MNNIFVNKIIFFSDKLSKKQYYNTCNNRIEIPWEYLIFVNSEYIATVNINNNNLIKANKGLSKKPVVVLHGLTKGNIVEVLKMVHDDIKNKKPLKKSQYQITKHENKKNKAHKYNDD